jgi:histidine triad (HIT) family protein
MPTRSTLRITLATGKNGVMTIFEKIIRREIPAEIVWEDDEAIAFRDVNPQAPVHVLIVPKRVLPRLTDATEEDGALLGRLLLASRKVAEKLDLLESGYRVVINSGPDAGESVPHLHLHVLGKRALAWPPG